jgi:hypothetical protein
MGGLIGFVFGYILGAKHGPERLDELRAAFESILQSREFKALSSSAMSVAQDALRQTVGQNGERTGELRAAWTQIAESEDFKALLASGSTMLGDLIAQGRARAGMSGNGAPRRDA